MGGIDGCILLLNELLRMYIITIISGDFTLWFTPQLCTHSPGDSEGVIILHCHIGLPLNGPVLLVEHKQQ